MAGLTGQTTPPVLLLATLGLILPCTLQHRFRDGCPCASLPQKELSVRQLYEEVTSTRRHRLYCCPHILLGFPATHYHNNTFNITWTFNGKEYPWVRETSTFKKTYCELETLETWAAVPIDEGIYSCKVTAANGTSVTRNISLCVNMNEDTFGPPVKSNISGDTERLPGEAVTFTCSAYMGRPSCLNPQQHKIIWEKELHNGSWVSAGLLRHARPFYSENKDGNMWSSLEIRRVEVAHFGHYRCTVINQHGNLSLNLTLDRGVSGMTLLAGQYRASLAVLTALVVFLVVSSCVWHRCRMVIALYCRSKTTLPPPDGYQYDVFVVHGESASCWVWSVLLPALEDTCGYTCFLPQRDMCGGDQVIEVVAEAVSRCRRVVVVVTPCLLACPWAAWAMYHGLQAALNAHTRVLALVLKDLKTTDISDTSGIMGILKLVRKINIPYCCSWHEDEPSQEVSSKTHETTDEDVSNTTELSRSTGNSKTKLMIPGDKTSTIRSRSRSPKNQRLSNMLTGNNVASKVIKTGVGGPVIYTEDVHGMQEPGSPCSITPFILPSRGSARTASNNTTLLQSLKECARLLCTGDQEKMFWQTVHYHLGPSSLQRRLNDHDQAYKL